MSLVIILYLVFALLSLGLFAVVDARRAIAIIYLVGLVYLPPADYPAVRPGSFPYWIIGAALPSNLLLAKAWVAPVVALIGALGFSPAPWRAFRPTWLDVVMGAWCLWPLLQAVILPFPAAPPGWLSTVYLMGSWGAPWLIGRVYFREADDVTMFLEVLALVSVSMVPFALAEAVAGTGLYNWLIQPHPFLRDGAERYIGERPLLFLEHGNQYGIWICCAALAGVGLVQGQAGYRSREFWLIVTLVLLLMALAAQSAGALVLLGFALICLLVRGARRWLRLSLIPALAGLLLLGGAYASGVIPVRAWVEHSAVGRTALDMIRATGRGSLTWRVSQDQRAVPIIAKAPLVGAGRWNWWMSLGTRPWGLAMLILGQFGLVGFILAAIVLCGPALRAAFVRTKGAAARKTSRLLALLIVMAVADALLNAFVFLPMIALAAMLAGGIKGRGTGRRMARSDGTQRSMGAVAQG